jgi:modulator of FtsH protease
MLSSVDLDAELITAWQPFFTVSAGAAAALAGLLFIALSIHVREIAAHRAFRYRALATLSIPLAVLVVSGLVLVPRQSGRTLGLAELVPLLLQFGAVVGWFQNARASVTMARAYAVRTVIGLVLILVAIAGAAILALGFESGLAILAFFCLASLVWMGFNSWALLFAIADAEKAEERRTADAAERPTPVDVIRA